MRVWIVNKLNRDQCFKKKLNKKGDRAFRGEGGVSVLNEVASGVTSEESKEKQQDVLG